MDRTGLRAWGGAITTSLAFPLAALGAALLVFATAGVSAGLVGALVVALVPWALLAGQVRLPPWAMAAAGAGVPALMSVGYEAPGAIFLALLAVAWLAATGGLRAELGAGAAAPEVAAFAVTLAAPVVGLARYGEWREDYPFPVFFGTGTLLAWLIGRILRRERQLVAALTDAQGRLDAAAAAAERRRIAVDVHDAVGHGLSVVLLNVVGARQVLERDPAAAGEALDRAERVGRESLDSVRGIVGLLREPAGDPTGTRPPPPGATDLAALLHTAAASGLALRSEVSGDLSTVDAYAGLAAYRLTQEALSNVEHHAPGADVLVRLTREPGRLAVSVRNGPSRRAASGGRGGGTGLDGMRQRVGALGGTVSAGPDGDGWLVEATLPLRDGGAPGAASGNGAAAGGPRHASGGQSEPIRPRDASGGPSEAEATAAPSRPRPGRGGTVEGR
ncbi:sensor histidine kinase [Phytohabitans kaempferiae]|uniref:histidine kinase n=1 Tax=Phytohabitans kaempferiae TaxID=1620943 RepID=A0ABV6MH40_9ACTN